MNRLLSGRRPTLQSRRTCYASRLFQTLGVRCWRLFPLFVAGWPVEREGASMKNLRPLKLSRGAIHGRRASGPSRLQTRFALASEFAGVAERESGKEGRFAPQCCAWRSVELRPLRGVRGWSSSAKRKERNTGSRAAVPLGRRPTLPSSGLPSAAAHVKR
jgi:hypothetical protein